MNIILILLALAIGPARASTTLNVLDQKTLQDLEARGFSLGEVLGSAKSLSNASTLYDSNTFYRDVADTLGRHLDHDGNTDQLPAVIPPDSGDIPDMVRAVRGFEDKGARSDKDLKGGYVIRQVSNNSSNPYAVEQDGDEPRHFDERWLWSKYAHFNLVAVVNRLDRADVTKDSCGEVRFVYRLVYTAKTNASSLPFFINVVEAYPKAVSCAKFARAWQGKDVRLALTGLEFRQLETNFQSMRFTSGYMHDFGGQAMYMQRIFRKAGSRLVPVGLENTPDVDALAKDPKLRAEFAAYLKRPEILAAIDEGTVDIDGKFLTKLSISWSTLGRAREVNRPFSQIFRDNAQLLADLDLKAMKYVKSKNGFLERLDNLSCMGCHQAGGTAGFHMLGNANARFSHPFNRQQLARSPHAMAEESRRLAWVEALAAGRTPNRLRPHSTAPAGNWSGPVPVFEPLQVGQLCHTEDDFASRPRCGDARGRAMSCRKTVTGRAVGLGECVLEKPAAGSVCWQGDLREGRKGPFGFTDHWKLGGSVVEDLKDYSCVLPQSGAPLGRMSRRCTPAEESLKKIDFAKGIPDEICANQGGLGFDMCAASGDSGACLQTKVARSMLDTCSPKRACREDYICQQIPEYQNINEKDYVRRKNDQLINLIVPNEIDGGVIARAHQLEVGFCVPTYFLFNMRLDGHPSPVTGLAPGAPKIDRKLPLRGYAQ